MWLYRLGPLFLALCDYILRYNYYGSREKSEVAGLFVFSHKRMMGYFRLCYVM